MEEKPTTIRVVLLDQNETAKHNAVMPGDVALRALTPKIISRMGLPTTSPDGAEVIYKLFNKTTGRQLNEDLTLTENGVTDNDALRVVGEILAG